MKLNQMNAEQKQIVRIFSEKFKHIKTVRIITTVHHFTCNIKVVEITEEQETKNHINIETHTVTFIRFRGQDETQVLIGKHFELDNPILCISADVFDGKYGVL